MFDEEHFGYSSREDGEQIGTSGESHKVARLIGKDVWQRLAVKL